jgi:uncharacterized protein YndB with AHSA1/START domain
VSTFKTSREIPAPPTDVFAAISDPVRLARWWGPAGFTNTFKVCEFRPGGKWSFIMHGPDGTNYPNENTFVEVDPARKVVIRHLSEPKFDLTIELSPAGSGTLVRWTQILEDAAFARRVEAIITPANEQNLDRLTAEVSRGRSSAPVQRT